MRALKQSRIPRQARQASACLTSALVKIHFSCERRGRGEGQVAEVEKADVESALLAPFVSVHREVW